MDSVGEEAVAVCMVLPLGCAAGKDVFDKFRQGCVIVVEVAVCFRRDESDCGAGFCLYGEREDLQGACPVEQVKEVGAVKSFTCYFESYVIVHLRILSSMEYSEKLVGSVS